MHSSEVSAGQIGTAVVDLPRGTETVFGMWQERVDGNLFFVFSRPVQNTVSTHVLNVSTFTPRDA